MENAHLAMVMLGAAPTFSLDVLPGRSGIESEAEQRSEGIRVRFRVYEMGRWRNRIKRYSAWSDWVPYEGEPIALRWADFWEAP